MTLLGKAWLGYLSISSLAWQPSKNQVIWLSNLWKCQEDYVSLVYPKWVDSRIGCHCMRLEWSPFHFMLNFWETGKTLSVHCAEILLAVLSLHWLILLHIPVLGTDVMHFCSRFCNKSLIWEKIPSKWTLSTFQSATNLNDFRFSVESSFNDKHDK